MRYERPSIADLGSIADHTFDTPPVPSPGGGDNKGFVNCRIEETNCELSHPGS